MANITVTYNFTNGTAADADQVDQNFSDVIAGTSDGTKDFSINALTVAGALTANGNVTLGNATGDDVTVTGSLASGIPIKTTNTYNIGSSTLGLAGVYLGANSQTVRLVGSASMSATWTFTYPVTAGTANFFLITNGSGVTSWNNGAGLLGGITDGNEATAGTVGEYHQYTDTSNDFAATGVWNDFNDGDTQLNLTAGDWDITFQGFVRTGTSLTTFTVGISTTSGNSGTGLADGDSSLDYTAASNANRIPFCVTIRQRFSSTTNYYAKMSATYIGTTPNVAGKIFARRRR